MLSCAVGSQKGEESVTQLNAMVGFPCRKRQLKSENLITRYLRPGFKSPDGTGEDKQVSK